MTPAKVYNEASKDPDNYDLEDKDSDDSTDDEEAPKKTIPEWACGMYFKVKIVLIKIKCCVLRLVAYYIWAAQSVEG